MCTYIHIYIHLWPSLVAPIVKNLPAIRETWVLSLVWEDPLEEHMATHSSSLAWRIPMDRGTCMVGYTQSMGSQRVGHDWTTKHSTAYIYIYMYMYICIHTHTYTYIQYTHICVCIYLYIHIYFHSYWSSMPFYRGSSQPRDWTPVSYISCIGSWLLHH